jgi:hypothetical protein
MTSPIVTEISAPKEPVVHDPFIDDVSPVTAAAIPPDARAEPAPAPPERPQPAQRRIYD